MRRPSSAANPVGTHVDPKTDNNNTLILHGHGTPGPWTLVPSLVREATSWTG